MEQLVEFIVNHFILSAIFIVLAGLLIQDVLSARFSGIQTVGPAHAIGLINHEEAVVLDVREDAEFSGGHIVNSIHIPLSKMPNKAGQLEKYKTQAIIVSCRTGSRSGAACKQLKKLGFEKLYNLRGGIAAWQSANLPLTKQK